MSITLVEEEYLITLSLLFGPGNSLVLKITKVRNFKIILNPSLVLVSYNFLLILFNSLHFTLAPAKARPLLQESGLLYLIDLF